MRAKEVKINIPEGYEIDKDNSTFECIKFKKKVEVNTWKDITLVNGFYINGVSNIIGDCGRAIEGNKKYLSLRKIC